MKASEVIKLIEKQGWYEVRQRGSHRIYKHDSIQKIITVPEHGKDDLKPGLLSSILKTAGVK
ncbi:type II toxin-antitoxin system HicA family toxin [uncultured Fibrella sp.]|uniref:type II toxin-antitoxin system HicA family toxin n=1 Tax=uncultured Fibrella sp. TaxID=1284596 RepID=UPI0035CACC91